PSQHRGPLRDASFPNDRRPSPSAPRPVALRAAAGAGRLPRPARAPRGRPAGRRQLLPQLRAGQAGAGGHRPEVRLRAPSHQLSEAPGWLAPQPPVELARTRSGLSWFAHRTLALVDCRCAWSGVRNFTRASFFEYHGVSFTLEGPLVGDLVAAYDEAWKQAG